MNASIRRRALISASMLGAVIVSHQASASDVNATWLGGEGNWSDGSKWSTAPNYPSNGDDSYTAAIGSGTVNVDGVFNVNVTNLSGGQLKLSGTALVMNNAFNISSTGVASLDASGFNPAILYTPTVQMNGGALSTNLAYLQADNGLSDPPIDVLGIAVGTGGSGSITLTNGAAVSDTYACAVGVFPQGNGTLSISGAGTSFTNTGANASFGVGFEGTGTLTLSSNAFLHTAGTSVGFESSGKGNVFVSGTNTTWVDDVGIAIGFQGIGTLTMSSGSILASAGIAVGRVTGSAGTIQLNGGTITTAGIAIGGFSDASGDENHQDGGSGTVLVAGGMLNTAAIEMGGDPSGVGRLDIIGPTSQVNVGSFVVVGGSVAGPAGRGNINITSGGQLIAAGPLIVYGTAGSGVSIQQGLAAVGGFTNTGIVSIGAAGALKISSGSFGNAGSVDVSGVLLYDGSTPEAAIRGQIISGRAGGSWTGAGINSSIAALSPRFAVGYVRGSDIHSPSFYLNLPVDASTIIIRSTYTGDSNLDGTVNSSDFALLAANFGGTGKEWVNGDYNYDGTVNALDFNALATNYGQSLSASAVPDQADMALGAFVPEPDIAVWGMLMAWGGARRARRQ